MVKRNQKSLLTDAHREYLESDQTGYSSSQQWNKREGIKKRVRWGLRDFSILVNGLPEDKRDEYFKDIFGFATDSDEVPSDGEVREGARDAIQFLYTGLERFSPHGSFKSAVESGTTLAELERGGRQVPDPTFEMEYERGGGLAESTIEKLEEERIDELTFGEMYSFLRLYSESPAFDPEDAIEYLRHQYGTTEHPPGEYEPDYSFETESGGNE